MPKIKLSLKELERISRLLEKDLTEKSSSLKNMKKQNFQSEERLVNMQVDDIEFINVIREKIDSKTFGK